MLKAIIEGKNYGLNDLKGYVLNFGKSELFDDLSIGRLPVWLRDNFRIYRIFNDIAKQVKNTPLNDEEKGWIGGLENLVKELDSFDLEKYGQMNQDDKNKYAMHLGKTAAERIYTLVKGYVDLENPRCPSSPNARADANWKDWEDYIDPLKYFDLMNTLPFVRRNGAMIPPIRQRYKPPEASKRSEGITEINEAIAELRKELKQNHKNIDAHCKLGLLLHAQKKLLEANVECEIVLALDPDNILAHMLKGRILQDEGQHNEALVEFKTAVMLDPDNAGRRVVLGRILATRGMIDQAIEEFQTAINLDHSNAAAHDELGRVLISAGKLDEGVAECRKSVELEPDNSIAYFNLGAALKAHGKLDEAIAAFRKAIELDSTNSTAHNSLGLVLQAQGKMQEAIDAYDAAIDTDPHDAAPHNNLGLLMARLGDFRSGTEEVRKAIELAPQNPGLYRNLGLLLTDQKKIDEAINVFEHALALLASMPTIPSELLGHKAEIEAALKKLRG